MKRAVFIILPLFLLTFSLCNADGLGSLIGASSSMDSAQKAYDAETAQFSKVKGAVEKGAIHNGMSMDDISKKYGRPQVSFMDASTKKLKWVYKPGASDYFTGMKIYLFFGDNNLLDKIDMIETMKK